MGYSQYSKNYLVIFSIYTSLNVILTLISLVLTQNFFTYCLDDSYIHLSIADNLAKRGIWSVTSNEFESASSSIFYTLLLAGFRLIINDFRFYIFVPLILNHLFNLLILKLFFDWSISLNIDAKKASVLSILCLFLIPTINNPFIGMEHSIQTYLAMELFYRVFNTIENEHLMNSYRNKFLLIFLCFLSTGFRYEAFFLLIPIIFVFFIKKRYLFGLLLGVTGLIPNVLFAIYSVSNGGLPLPTSILMKTINKQVLTQNSPILDILYFIASIVWNIISGFPLVLGIVLVCIISFYSFDEKLQFKQGFLKSINRLVIKISSDKYFAGCFIFVIASIMHVITARMLWFFRYESYLVAILYFLMILFSVRLNLFGRLYDYFKLKISYIFTPTKVKNNKTSPTGQKIQNVSFKDYFDSKFSKFFAIVFIILFVRGIICFVQIPLASRNIYQQQYQMAKFINRYYNNRTVAANDIGAVNLFSDAYILDLVGLSNPEIAELRMNRNYTTEALEYLVKKYNVSIAIIYEYWFSGTYDFLPRRPDSWKKVAEWTINLRVISDRETVSFWAIDPSGVDELKSNLMEFESTLPPDVKVKYF